MVLSPACYAAQLGNTLNALSGMLKIDVFMEEGIETTEVVGMPKTINNIPSEELVKRCLNGVSYGTLYEGDRIAKLWVYKSGKCAFVRISSYDTDYNPVPADGYPETTADTRYGTTKSPLRAPPEMFDRKTRTTKSGYSYKENSFGYRQPVFNTHSIKNSFSKIKNRPALNLAGASSNSGASDYLARKQMALEEERNSRSAMMNHLKSQSIKAKNE